MSNASIEMISMLKTGVDLSPNRANDLTVKVSAVKFSPDGSLLASAGIHSFFLIRPNFFAIFKK
jgi:hypothetical protein